MHLSVKSSEIIGRILEQGINLDSKTSLPSKWLTPSPVQMTLWANAVGNQCDWNQVFVCQKPANFVRLEGGFTETPHCIWAAVAKLGFWIQDKTIHSVQLKRTAKIGVQKTQRQDAKASGVDKEQFSAEDPSCRNLWFELGPQGTPSASWAEISFRAKIVQTLLMCHSINLYTNFKRNWIVFTRGLCHNSLRNLGWITSERFSRLCVSNYKFWDPNPLKSDLSVTKGLFTYGDVQINSLCSCVHRQRCTIIKQWKKFNLIKLGLFALGLSSILGMTRDRGIISWQEKGKYGGAYRSAQLDWNPNGLPPNAGIKEKQVLLLIRWGTSTRPGNLTAKLCVVCCTELYFSGGGFAQIRLAVNSGSGLRG